MKKHLLIIFLICCSCFAFAQNKKTDSLLNLLKTNKEDTNKVKVLYEICKNLYNMGNYPKVLLYANQVKELATTLEFKKGVANAYNIIGNVYLYQGNYPEALKNHLASLRIRKEMGNKQAMAASYNNIGGVYYNQGNYPETIRNYFAALKIYEEIGNKQGIANSYMGIGQIYSQQGNYPEALKNDFAALSIHKEMGDKLGISNLHNNIGIVYFNQKNYPEALKNYSASLKIRKEIGNPSSIANSYNNIGDVYNKQSNYPEALKNFIESLKIKEEIGDKNGIETALINIGATYKDLKNYKDAETYCIKALNLAKEIGELEGIMGANKLLSYIYKVTGRYKQSLETYEAYIRASDSLLNEQSKIESLQIANKYESEKKEKEIALLKVDQTIAEAQHKRKQLIYASVILIIAIIAFFLLNRQRLKSKKDKIIFEKQEALLQAEKQKTEGELLHAKNLLNNYTENLIEKNKTVEELQFEIEKLKGLKAAEIYKEKIDNLDDLNNATILTNEDWEKFKELFEQVYKGFFTRLKEKIPNLTNAETRLISLIKLNLDAKQMAGMLGVSPNTITMTKYRLRKKINLTDKQDLDLLVQSV